MNNIMKWIAIYLVVFTACIYAFNNYGYETVQEDDEESLACEPMENSI